MAATPACSAEAAMFECSAEQDSFRIRPSPFPCPANQDPKTQAELLDYAKQGCAVFQASAGAKAWAGRGRGPQRPLPPGAGSVSVAPLAPASCATLSPLLLKRSPPPGTVT